MSGVWRTRPNLIKLAQSPHAPLQRVACLRPQARHPSLGRAAELKGNRMASRTCCSWTSSSDWTDTPCKQQARCAILPVQEHAGLRHLFEGWATAKTKSYSTGDCITPSALGNWNNAPKGLQHKTRTFRGKGAVSSRALHQIDPMA